MLLLRTSRGVDPGIPLLRSLGSNAHVWAPGANGTTVASLPSNNYLLSDGSTGYSTVDGVDGLDLDGMGRLGSERVTNGDFSSGTTGWGWYVSFPPQTFANVSGELRVANDGVARALFGQSTSEAMTAGETYRIRLSVRLASGALPGIALNTAFYSATLVTLQASGPTGLTTYTYDIYYKAVSTGAVHISFDSYAAFDIYIDNVSIKPYTGTHLTQATTANKPLVRRGAYNLIAMSEALGTAPWSTDNVTITDAQAANAGGQLTLCKVLANASVGANILQSFTSPSTALTMRFLCRMGNIATRGNRFSLYNVSTASELARFTINYSTGAIAHSIGSGATATDLGGGLWEVKLTQTTGIIAGHAIYVYGGYIGNTATAGDFAYIGEYHVEAGTSFTTYTPTTTTAASNSSAGKYWWSFDGSNDSLLSGNLGITTACTIVIAGRVNSLAAINYLMGEDTNGFNLYVATSGAVGVGKTWVTNFLNSAAGQIVAGVPFVLTFRLSAGAAVIRKNGVQIATVATATVFSATTGLKIGMDFGAALPTNGAIGWVVPLSTALSDADCLTVERLVGSQFPGMATF